MRWPKWFRGLVVAALFAACACVAWYTVSTAGLQTRLADLTLSLETSRGREARQTKELADVNAELPQVQDALAELQPQAEAAAAAEADLRAKRKQARADYQALSADTDALEEALAQAQADAQALLTQADALLGGQ